MQHKARFRILISATREKTSDADCTSARKPNSNVLQVGPAGYNRNPTADLPRQSRLPLLRLVIQKEADHRYASRRNPRLRIFRYLSADHHNVVRGSL